MRNSICRWLGLLAGISTLLISSLSWGVIPTNALMKTLSGTNYVFPANSPYVLDPNAVNPTDHAAAIQAAIDAIKGSWHTVGGVIFIKEGTYYLKRPLIIRGDGVTLVGLRYSSSSNFPTFEYGDDFYDADYVNRANIQTGTVGVLEYPAVIRINGNDDYGNGCAYHSHGVRGLNIKYIGTNLTSQGGKATAIAVQAIYHTPLQDVIISGSSTNNGPYNGVDMGDCMMPLLRNVTISNVRGDFGLRAGDAILGSHSQKYHGLTITAPVKTNSTTDLIKVRSEGEFIGLNLQGGRVGIDIAGPGPLQGQQSANICLRSVKIANTAQQGIQIKNVHGLWFTDIQIDDAGAEGIKVLDGFYGGLQMANLRINRSGLSAIRVERGMGISIGNAELLRSGMKKPTDPNSTNLPIAGISIGPSVTSLNIVGARVGGAGTETNEDWGIYVSTNTPPAGKEPWHTQKIIAANFTFLSNLTNKKAFGTTVLSGSYSELTNDFRTVAGETWAIQKLPTDPEFSDSWLKQVRGFNWYDLPEVRNAQWIDLTSTNFSPRIIGTNGVINSAAFSTLLDDVYSSYPNGAVLYLPAGRFSNTNFTAYTTKYWVWSGVARNYTLDTALIIDRPKIQLLGDGDDVTKITVSHQTTNSYAPPVDSAIQLVSGSQGSGLFSFSMLYSVAASKPNPIPAGYPGAPMEYEAPIRLDGTSQIRLAGLSLDDSMGGGIHVIDSYDCEFSQLFPNAAVNNSTNKAMALFDIEATSQGSTHDIRLWQCNGGWAENIYLTTPLVPTNGFFKWNDADSYLRPHEFPKCGGIRVLGGVERIRVDCGGFGHVKDGLVTVAGDGIPKNLSTFRFVTDHISDKAIHLIDVENADILSSWQNASLMNVLFDTNVTGNIRIINQGFRGGGLEGLSIRGGSTVSVVNCQAGITCGTTGLKPQENRPLAGIYIGSNVTSSVRIVGGISGWLFNSKYDGAVTNVNPQDWGIVLGTGFSTNKYKQYGVDLDGNGGANARHPSPPGTTNMFGYQRGLGQQVNNGTNATWISDAATYP